VNVQLIVAGALGIVAAGIHGGAGEVFVVRRLSPGALAPSPFGGPGMTRAMIHVTWHIATVAFLTLGLALLVAGLALHGSTARGIGVVGAVGFTGFATAAVAFGGVHVRSRRLLAHPGPIVLAATAAMAWWGAL
jgi:hypothetical protein